MTPHWITHALVGVLMAKIKHARKFGDLPTPRHTAVMDEIENEKQTDRAVAVIGAAYVDLVLRDAIAAKLLPDPNLMAELFENRGPLQDFGSRIHVVFALGSCGPAAYHDLRAIKDIRNAFAHSAEAMDFNHKDVARLCGTLWYPQTISVAGRPSPQTPRQQYIRAIELLTDLFLRDLMLRQRGMRGEDLIMAPGLFGRATAKKSK
jgi:hypothetical protein